ncbi:MULTISPECIES: hypothetical protein [unclassified Imperialibacter]|uniref:hypothetical protein n=1 Tax=unclassified Imperialibacter TaxID=2629706 RepID=UPI001259D160|nr:MULTISPECIES: hypothetical protein [unclassified Imperialibacter]CAD5274689.1 conserved hypothetical protein [Imperialibacter sp. 75]CAD5288354.1 conserved hypothetical protein [Imperialibacter sp. 89]VVT35612.1 conserved hypothetical protein [Imperialibacter sp. EC-SDR9]
MISIIYPEGDYSSSDLAIRLQALAQSQGKNTIYVVPKHLGRNPEAIYKKLSKSSTALLLMHDKTGLDKGTEEEIRYLLGRSKNIHAILPSNVVLPKDIEKKINVLPYGGGTNKAFADIVQETVRQLEPKNGAKSESGNDFAVLLALLAMVILFIGLSSDDGNK